MNGDECQKRPIVSLKSTVTYSANKSIRIHCLIKYRSRFLTAENKPRDLWHLKSRTLQSTFLILSDHFTYQKFRFLTFSKEEALALAKICCSDNLDIMYFKSISAMIRSSFRHFPVSKWEIPLPLVYTLVEIIRNQRI